MKEHVVSSRDCLTETAEEGHEGGAGPGEREESDDGRVNNSSQDSVKGGGLAH